MRRLTLLAALALASCTSGDPAGPHPIGAEVFVSTPPQAGGGGVPGAPELPAMGSADSVNAGPGTLDRRVAEADLYVRDGTTLYVQNAWRGLQIVDLADPAAPRLRGTAELAGTPVGLYLSGQIALVVSSDHLAWIAENDGGPARPVVGSRLWAVDVSDPDAPAVRAELALDGMITDTRLVGNVLYVVAQSLPAWMATPLPTGGMPASGGGAAVPSDTVTIASFDVSEPAAPRPVDAITLPDAGGYPQVNVTAERITVARAGWDDVLGGITRLTAVDIRDPAGALLRGAEVTVPGTVQNRWGLDLDAATGTFRAVVADGWSSGSRLHVVSWAEPGKAEPLSALDLDVPEWLTAARFDGPRAYVVTALAMDPLWVVDLADPAKPALAGRLELPGQLDFVAPRGDRLLALGHGDGTAGRFQLHVSLLDVADPAAPALVARETLEPDWAFVPGGANDVHQAFQVLDEQGLLLVPYQGFDVDGWRWIGGTQLLTFSRDALVREGFVPHAGDLRRVFPTATAGVIAAYSNERLQTIDVTDRAAPAELAALDLARPVWKLAVLGTRAVEVTGWSWMGMGECVVVPSADPNAPTPAWRAPLSAYGAQLFETGDVAWLASTEPRTGLTSLQAIDVAATPRLRGHLDLGRDADGYWWWGPTAVQAGSALVVMTKPPATDGSMSPIVTVVDLTDADAPRPVVEVPVVAAGWVGEPRAEGRRAWIPQYEVADGQKGTVRYTATLIDLSDPAAPVVSEPVNVPGQLFSVSADGARLYTEEQVWDGFSASTWIHTLERTPEGKARLVASAQLSGWYWGAVRAGNFAYVAGTAAGETQTRLAAVDLARGGARTFPLGASGARIVGVAGPKLLVSTSWSAPAVLVMDLADPARPALERTVRTAGQVQEVVVEDGVAYVAGAQYGVTRIPLQ